MTPIVALVITAHGHSSIAALITIGLALGMALSTQDPTLAKQRFFHAVSVQSNASIIQLAKSFMSWLMTQGGKPFLQVVELDTLSSTDVVIANAACTLYALVLQKATATASFFKAGNSTTVSPSDGTQRLSIEMHQTDPFVMFYPKGLTFTTGLSVRADTTGTGSTGSAANGPTGVFLIGA